jgi:hypothetical protein
MNPYSEALATIREDLQMFERKKHGIYASFRVETDRDAAKSSRI